MDFVMEYCRLHMPETGGITVHMVSLVSTLVYIFFLRDVKYLPAKFADLNIM
jgi:hypothetical protein